MLKLPPACRPLPEGLFGEQSREQPLINTRWPGVAWTEMGEVEGEVPPLDRLLRCQNPNGFGPISEVLWERQVQCKQYRGGYTLALA